MTRACFHKVILLQIPTYRGLKWSDIEQTQRNYMEEHSPLPGCPSSKADAMDTVEARKK